ncbi:MAG TPA: PEP-CTERM sorting domain-containing protein [Pirellulales bacterium]
MTKHTACQCRPVLATLCLMAFVFVVLAFEISLAVAADYSWANPVSGDFDGPTNWTPAGGPPGANDTAIFNLGSTGYTVSSTLADTLQQLRVDNDTVTFQSISGRSLSATGTTLPAISFGNNSGDVANVTLNRPLKGVNDAVGYAAGSQATVTLGSGNVSWTDTNLYIGYAGQGTVNLPISSTLSSTNSMVLGDQTGSQGTVTVGNSGAAVNTSSLIVGGSGTGKLSVTAGSIGFKNQMIVGQNAGSTGTATLDGKNSTFVVNSGANLIVAQDGQASMSLTNGAAGILNGTLVIGQDAGSQGSFTIADVNSKLQIGSGIPTTPDVTVGAAGQGSLSLSGGGNLLSLGPVVAGQSAGSVGTISVAGTNSGIGVSSGGLTIGVAGQGDLSVTGGGSILATGLAVGSSAGSHGAVTVDGTGSKIAGVSVTTIGVSGSGSLDITNGGNLGANSSLIVGANASSQGTVTLDGTGSILSAGNLTTGGAGHGSIAVTGGSELLTSSSTIIGRDQASQGTISVDGAQSKFVLAGSTIGQSGQGNLKLSGESVTTASGKMVVGQAVGGAGNVTISGATANLQNLVVAQDGTGQFNLQGGGTVAAQDVTIGADIGANGSISASDSGTTLTARNLSIGTGGVGQLSASNGAALSATSNVIIGGTGSLSLASGATLSSQSLTIAPTTATATGQGQLSLDGAGTKYTLASFGSPMPMGGAVTISNGATWTTAPPINVGAFIGNKALVTVSGAGSQWNSSGSPQVFDININSTSQLVVNNKGAVTAPTIADYGTISMNTGATLSTSNTLDVAGSLEVGTGANITSPSLVLVGGSNVDLNGGGTVTLGSATPAATVLDAFTSNAVPSGGMIQIDVGGILSAEPLNTGPIGGVSSVTGTILNQGGTVSLQGESVPSHLNVSGDFTQQSGTLALLMAGTPYNASNELHVAGNVSLSGVLELDISSFQDFPVHVGETFDLIFASGNFNTPGLTVEAKGAFGVPLPAGFAYTTQLSDGVFSMTVTSVPEPSTLVLTGLCALGVVLLRRRS